MCKRVIPVAQCTFCGRIIVRGRHSGIMQKHDLETFSPVHCMHRYALTVRHLNTNSVQTDFLCDTTLLYPCTLFIYQWRRTCNPTCSWCNSLTPLWPCEHHILTRAQSVSTPHSHEQGNIQLSSWRVNLQGIYTDCIDASVLSAKSNYHLCGILRKALKAS